MRKVDIIQNVYGYVKIPIKNENGELNYQDGTEDIDDGLDKNKWGFKYITNYTSWISISS